MSQQLVLDAKKLYVDVLERYPDKDRLDDAVLEVFFCEVRVALREHFLAGGGPIVVNEATVHSILYPDYVMSPLSKSFKDAGYNCEDIIDIPQRLNKDGLYEAHWDAMSYQILVATSP